ncbi:proprotein convertase P-domain-containing protein [Bacillus thuringiensis]|uniref:proprotein convertase P-domain-containing protein n=1 Tax=Bacillus thuringiensis TaxID=1428 RepID=UPI0020C29A85|nr:proprotein convertase P-domain-containing protein [Bacillus thuringiensis]
MRKYKFTNPSNIAFPATGLATPFPSKIIVSGLQRSIKKVTVTIHDFSHTFPDDVHILLVGPQGQTAYLMGDAGGNADAINLTITFDDDALNALPDNQLLRSGVFRPSVYRIDAGLPGPTPYGTALSVFRGKNPNGIWNLYALDDTAVDSGNIGNGWTVEFELNC